MNEQDIKIHSIFLDYKINAINIGLEMSKKTYLSIAKEIKKNNEYQRNRIKRASSVYSLMKSDLLEGCLLPTIVLALDDKKGILDNLPKEDLNEENFKKNIQKYIVAHSKSIKILDGLQRTNMLLDVDAMLEKENTEEKSHLFYKTPLRFELYLGANRYGILYRMLTLNAGQTPMTLRHQIEILYGDLYNNENSKNDIYLIKEVDNGNKQKGVGRYHFDDIIDGMEAYIQENEFTIDKYDILEYVKNMEKISKDPYKKDVFNDFLEAYHTFILKINELFGDTKFDERTFTEEEKRVIDFEENKPFANTPIGVFTSAQAIAGFGASISFLDLKELKTMIKNIKIKNPQQDFNFLLLRLKEISKNARRIGDAQRQFFRAFFSFLLQFHYYSHSVMFKEAIIQAKNAVPSYLLKNTKI